jgi:hypothetical protein
MYGELGGRKPFAADRADAAEMATHLVVCCRHGEAVERSPLSPNW